jgi:hypothetical protein
MNANQVVIVMDREVAERTSAKKWLASDGPKMAEACRAALDRDPDELVERGAAALQERHIPSGWGISFDDCSDEIQDEYRAMARSVLAVLGEEGGPE